MAALKPATKEEKKRRVSRFAKRFTIGLTLFMVILQFFLVFRNLDDGWTDTLFQMRGMEKGDSRISIVTIDDTSIKKIGQYPWPRGVYRRLLTKLYGVGVKVTGFDIMFLDPSTPKEDRELIRATRDAKERLVLAINIDSSGEEYKTKARWSFSYPFPALKKVSKAFGLVTQTYVDPDGSVRVINLLIGKEGDPQLRGSWPTDPEAEAAFGLKVLSLFEGRRPEEYVKQVGANQVRLNYRGLVPERVTMEPQDDGSLKPVVEPARHAYPRIPAWRILEDKLNPAEKQRLKGGMVLVGSTASGAFDHYPTAFDGATPGVLFHAYLTDNILNDNYLRTTPAWLAFLVMLLFAVAAYFIVSLPALFAGLAFLGLMGGWVLTSYFSFVNLYVLEFWAPALTFGVLFLTLIVHKTMLEQQQKREVRNMFGQYVAPEVVAILVKDPDKLTLGGQKRDMTMFFLDIAHFTTISEKMSPENLIEFLNTYLTALTDDILRNNGVVDKYIGDCIMAFWNAPLDEPAHRKKSCLAAVDCLKTIERLNKEYVDPTMPETPAVRIGLNSGEVVVGNTGSARKLAYTVLGDEVNLASRLEGANKFFGSTVMASEDTFKDAKDAIEGRQLGSVRVVGKEIPIGVFELLGRKGELSKEWYQALESYNKGVEIYLKRDFEKAKAEFEKVLKIIPHDKPAKLYLSVCEDYVAIPPPEREDWAVFNLTSK
ncbi:CHASE2 domain-containing protein [Elusimicrobiota bacterium]